MYEVIGDDDLDALAGDDIAIGASPIAKRAALRAARAIDPNAVFLKKSELSDRRRKLLPGNSNPAVGAGATASVTYTTQEVFRPERYVVDPNVSGDFVVTSITVGTKNQLAAQGEVPASVFDPTAFDCNVNFDTANPGVDIVVWIKNISGATATYRAVFLGTSVS